MTKAQIICEAIKTTKVALRYRRKDGGIRVSIFDRCKDASVVSGYVRGYDKAARHWVSIHPSRLLQFEAA